MPILDRAWARLQDLHSSAVGAAGCYVSSCKHPTSLRGEAHGEAMGVWAAQRKPFPSPATACTLASTARAICQGRSIPENAKAVLADFSAQAERSNRGKDEKINTFSLLPRREIPYTYTQPRTLMGSSLQTGLRPVAGQRGCRASVRLPAQPAGASQRGGTPDSTPMAGPLAYPSRLELHP